MPPPDNSAKLTGAQWSRPASLLIFGVRPNSPHTTTRHVAIQSALVDILDQRRDALIKQRQMLLQPAEIIAVRIPETVGHGHAAGSRFDQPPGHQQLIVPHRAAVAQVLGRTAAVAIAHGLILFFDVHGVDQLAAGEHIERAAVGANERSHAGAVDRAAEVVEVRQQFSSR